MYSIATFAGGCFWCMVKPFATQEGIIQVVSGYTGGHTENPTYKEVCSDTTGHYEAVQITYDPAIYSYEKLVSLFWQQIDPTDEGGQFHDRGLSYAAAIFYHTKEQKQIAEQSKQQLIESKRFSKAIVTKILPVKEFYPAEDNHQDYYKKNPAHYERYRTASGRVSFLKENWRDTNLKEKLTSLQYEVTQLNGTEPPFQNEYWNNKRVGLYVDIVSGEVLFSSNEKFDSGCGWPSFTKPLHAEHIESKRDTTHRMIRTEVRSTKADSHLGHVFEDGPKETGGLRYCINSASLRFIPKEKLEEEGYGQYGYLF